MTFEYYYSQIPLEVRCLAPWQDNKHADEVWGMFNFLIQIHMPISYHNLFATFEIKKHKQFRKLIRPLLDSGMVSQRVINDGNIFDYRNWGYEATHFGHKYYDTMFDLILPRSDA